MLCVCRVVSAANADQPSDFVRLARKAKIYSVAAMSTVPEVEAALEKFTPEQMREVADWLMARLLPEETPEILAAIDQGLRSLETEPTLSVEEVRENIRTWSTQ